MTRLPGLLVLLAATAAASPAALADQLDDEVERLPGQGEIKDLRDLQIRGGDRLIPGGGLFLSFDADRDGRATQAEVAAGVDAAYTEADANGDGRLSPLEQAAWAESLPTRDASLANPARFDPNLDRSVTREEFAFVVTEFAASLAEPGTGDVVLASLKASKRPDRQDFEENIDAAQVDPRRAPRRRQP